jgi:hypothetical protein
MDKRNKWAEAQDAYRHGSERDLPSDNPYRWLVANHDANPSHRGMQRDCPACSLTAGGVR